MFELPSQFSSFIETAEINVAKGLTLGFSLPNASQHDWSSLHADKQSTGDSSRVRLYRRCILASCCVNMNSRPLSEFCNDEQQKKIATAIQANDLSTVSMEQLSVFYEQVLSQIIGKIPEQLIEAAYNKFSAWIQDKTFEIMPMPTEPEVIDNLDVIGMLKNPDRGQL
ncbi:hypothetical protein [Yersinia ruckeri]|uniref:hypothetical protein n=1 Tax=Yersinia ruckeri TaxID=29486 RepID=UPI002237BC7B|nr:hypothetical protein [Yersinia ruckeri]MCW6598631.1 hypothetical protein [Yersinia ruckeri]